MSKRYTLTVYAAAPNTQLFDKETGAPLRDQDGNFKYSFPGHVYYSISDDGGVNKKGFGFAPDPSGMKAPGKRQLDEHKEYLNPAYERTIEITKEQYEALKKFGDNPNQYGFNTTEYRAFTHSCVDFVHSALRFAKVHDAKTSDYGGEVLPISFDGYIKVMPNKAIFQEIKPPFPNSDLNQEINRAYPKAPNIQRAISGFLLTENNQDLNGDLLFSNQTQKLFQQYDEKFTALCEKRGITADCKEDFENLRSAAIATALTNGLPNIEKVDIDSQTRTLWLGSYNPRPQVTSLSVDEAVNIPMSESMAKIHTIEQQNAQQAQERQMAQSQQQNHGLKIG